jgi:DNA-binding response OmpR family regulator
MKKNSKGTILLVEDDEMVGRAYKDGFIDAGLTVLIATDGEEAERVLKTAKPDLIVLDLMMPIKTGFDVLDEIKEKKWVVQDVPVVVLTVLAEKYDVERAKKAGAIDYLIKTQFSMEEVVHRILGHIKDIKKKRNGK